MNDQQIKDILFISVINMITSNRVELEKLKRGARAIWGKCYTLVPGYWASETRLQIEDVMANIEYCHTKINETICLN